MTVVIAFCSIFISCNTETSMHGFDTKLLNHTNMYAYTCLLNLLLPSIYSIDMANSAYDTVKYVAALTYA